MQTSILCKQDIYIKQIYYFIDSFKFNEMSNMTYVDFKMKLFIKMFRKD